MRQARIRWPEKPAVIVGARTLTYEELDRAANRFANAVLALLGPSTSKVAFCSTIASSTPSPYTERLVWAPCRFICRRVLLLGSFSTYSLKPQQRS